MKRALKTMLSDEEKATLLAEFIDSAKAKVPENSKSDPTRRKAVISGRFNKENLEFLSQIGGKTTTMMNCLVTVLREECIEHGLYTPPAPSTESQNTSAKPKSEM